MYMYMCVHVSNIPVLSTEEVSGGTLCTTDCICTVYVPCTMAFCCFSSGTGTGMESGMREWEDGMGHCILQLSIYMYIHVRALGSALIRTL